MADGPRGPEAQPRRSRWWAEGFVFLLLAVLIWPFIAIGAVAGWGFLVWMYYLFTGPPGPV
ncbi:nitrate reductase [Roseicella frigidaeris]|uniref:Nitrate reductase n=1 Tax=Roseicella frigidaeris TaxID=2230885 RepID=A0A327MCR3_9PROT|nr:nitrate reductase [Roseicella frigidaeris]